jgi:hypothetical protein
MKRVPTGSLTLPFYDPEYKTVSIWPPVKEDDWCGKYEANQNG